MNAPFFVRLQAVIQTFVKHDHQFVASPARLINQYCGCCTGLLHCGSTLVCICNGLQNILLKITQVIVTITYLIIQ